MLCRFSKQTFVAAALAALLAVAVFACAPERDTPLITSEEFGTPTPLPTPTATRLPEEAVQITGQRTSDAQTALDVVGKDVIKIANWKEGGPAMLNNLLGYFMVWGYDYTVELVEMEREDYRNAIEKGEVDLVLHVDTADEDTAGWLSSVVESETVLEGGKPLADSETIRIAMHPTLSERAPDLVGFLATATLPGEAFAKIAGSVKFGRIGVTPGVGAFKYLKEQGAVWNTWVSEEEASKVQEAIDSSKTSLRNRTCIPRGVEANDCGRN